MVDVFGPKKKPGALAPLFDRLTDWDMETAEEATPWGFLSPEEVKQSILSELEMLLNTRRPVVPKASEGSPLLPTQSYGAPVNYGLKELTAMNGTSKLGWKIVASSLEETIQQFEPRLKNPTVEVLNYDNLTQTLSVSITGTVYYGEVMERVIFPITF